MQHSTDIIYSAILVAVLLVLSHGCATEPDPQPPLQTVILEMQVEPNPVAVNDTATFTCIIEDSLDDWFRYDWNFGSQTAEDTVTQQNWITWQAPDTAGTFLHSVSVSNGSQDSLPDSRSFTIRVVGQTN